MFLHTYQNKIPLCEVSFPAVLKRISSIPSADLHKQKTKKSIFCINFPDLILLVREPSIPKLIQRGQSPWTRQTLPPRQQEQQTQRQPEGPRRKRWGWPSRPSSS